MLLNRKELNRVLTTLNRVVDHKSISPILRCIKIESADGYATLTSADFERILSVRIPAEGDLAAVCASGKALAATAKRGSKEIEILMSAGDSMLRVTNGSTTLTIPTALAEDFPAGNNTRQDWEDAGTLPVHELSDALKYVIPAVYRDAVKDRALSSVNFDTSGRVVAADKHRIHIVNLQHRLNMPILVARDVAKTLSELLGKTGEVAFRVAGGNVLQITTGDWVLESQLIAEDYPTYDRVVPEIRDDDTHVLANASDISSALDQVMSTSEKIGVMLRVTPEGASIESSDPACGDTFVQLPTIDYSEENSFMQIMIAKQYLREAIRHSGDVVILSITNMLDPVRVDMGNKTAVIMPMRQD